MDVVTVANITCPECEVKEKEEMPSDACQYFYECRSCRAVLKPKEGDCCVFCSFADVKCPPEQLKEPMRVS